MVSVQVVSLIINPFKLIPYEYEKQSAESVKSKISDFYRTYPEFELEYYEIADFESLESISKHSPERKTAIIIAAHLNGVRLIDNYIF